MDPRVTGYAGQEKVTGSTAYEAKGDKLPQASTVPTPGGGKCYSLFYKVEPSAKTIPDKNRPPHHDASLFSSHGLCLGTQVNGPILRAVVPRAAVTSTVIDVARISRVRIGRISTYVRVCGTCP